MGVIAHADRGASLGDLARTAYDVIVVGGGIFGAMVHLEASRAGLKSVLVERDDFGGGTSENSLRIVHGGLRYLKNGDVARSVESTRERQWYLKSLPRLVAPLPCLLPLYARGGPRPWAMRLALAANDAIGAAVRHLDGVLADVPRGYVVDDRTVVELAPELPTEGLAGGAVWHDLALRCPGRVVIEALGWAADFGGAAVNYVEARDLLAVRGRVAGVGVVAVDGRASAELRAPVIVNAAGPWAGELAARWGAADGRLAPLVAAWNVLLDRPPLSGHAVALRDPLSPDGALKFASSLGGRLLVGTGYVPLAGSDCESAHALAEAELDAFVAALNRCVPRLRATRRDVLRVYAGVLPAAAPGSCVPRARNLLSEAGPRGLITVSGTKFTTARAAARRALAVALRRGELRERAAARGRAARAPYPPCRVQAVDGLFGTEWTLRDLDARRLVLARIIANEAVEHLDDLVLRRTTLGDQPARALTAARALCALDERWRRDSDREVARLAARLGWRQAAWAMNKPGQGPPAVARTA